MKRILMALSVAALLGLSAYAAYRALASDETRIGWLLQDAAESFNGTDLRGCLTGFATDYRDTSARRLDRSLLAQALRFLFLRRVDARTKSFQLRVRLPEPTLRIDVDQEEATARFELRMERRRDGDWEDAWDLSVTANLRRTDDGWRIHRSSHETIRGSMPR